MTMQQLAAKAAADRFNQNWNETRRPDGELSVPTYTRQNRGNLENLAFRLNYEASNLQIEIERQEQSIERLPEGWPNYSYFEALEMLQDARRDLIETSQRLERVAAYV